MGADAVATDAELRLLVHHDLGDHPARRGFQPGEVDAGSLADQAASAVAADEVLRSHRRFPGDLDIDARVVLREAHHVAAAKDRNSELTDPVSQDRFEVALKEREDVVVASGEVAHVQSDQSETCTLHHLPRREEPFRDATLIEHLDGAGVKPACSRSVDLLIGAPFDDDDVHPRQRQLARQHQPGRTAACDHHCVVRHCDTSDAAATCPPRRADEPSAASRTLLNAVSTMFASRLDGDRGQPTLGRLRVPFEAHPRGCRRARGRAKALDISTCSAPPARTGSPPGQGRSDRHRFAAVEPSAWNVTRT